MAPAQAAPQELDAAVSDNIPPVKQHSTVECELPVIDMQGADGERRSIVIEQMRRAFEDWGIFQAVNHTVPASLVSKAQQLIRGFFMRSLEEKRKYATPSPNNTTETYSAARLFQGYASRDSGRSFLYAGDQLRLIITPESDRNYDLWPTDASSHSDLVEYVEEQEKFESLMFDLVSESLGLKTSHFNDLFEGKLARTLLSNHYPVCKDKALATGLHRHSDFSILTVLLQDAEGLEVCKDGVWSTVRVIPNALVVNLGDQMEILTNGRYRSAVHRVSLNSSMARVSITSFTYPTLNTVVAPVPELVPELESPSYLGCAFSVYRQVSAALQDSQRDAATIQKRLMERKFNGLALQ